MKTFLALVFLLCQTAFSVSIPGRIDASSTNITTSYSASVVSDFGDNYRFTTVMVNNGAATNIAVYCSTSSSAPASGSILFDVPAGRGVSVSTDLGLIRYCYPKSRSGTISSGVVDFVGLTN